MGYVAAGERARPSRNGHTLRCEYIERAKKTTGQSHRDRHRVRGAVRRQFHSDALHREFVGQRSIQLYSNRHQFRRIREHSLRGCVLHDLAISKGGFVSVPVVLAGKRCKVPVIIHESDMTPGLANKLAIPSAVKVCCNFPETLDALPEGKAVLTGSPIRQELLTGDKDAARKMCGFTDEKPVILVIGGSLGAVAVNEAVRAALPELLKQFQIIHLCGKGKVDHSLKEIKGYCQFEYIKNELRDLFALADVVISRAGANAICELLALRKPNLLIPLSARASRGDQILNAHSFERQGFSLVIEEEQLTNATLLDAVHNLYENREQFINAMHNSGQQDPIATIIGLIEEAATK